MIFLQMRRQLRDLDFEFDDGVDPNLGDKSLGPDVDDCMDEV